MAQDPGLPALATMAEMAADRIVAALRAAGPSPTRTRLIVELGRTAPTGADVPAVHFK